MGKGRKHFNDVFALDTTRWLWSRVETQGEIPRRSSHQAHIVDQCMFVVGGSDAATSFGDVWYLDLASKPARWTLVNAALAIPLWSSCSTIVNCVPAPKLFFFGGLQGAMLESGIGVMNNALTIFDCGQQRWLSPPMVHNNGSSGPCPRSDASMVLDSKNSRLIVFGGWADRWLDDMFSLDVSKLIGPPYVLTGLVPCTGPITGGTELSIVGLDFINTADIIVRMGKYPHNVDIPGVFHSQTLITCRTPDFRSLSLEPVLEVRIALNGDSFTTSYETFQLFTITNASNSLLFGPGLLDGCVVKEETSFLIVAKDNRNEYRTSGGDKFSVLIHPINKDGDVDITTKVPGVSLRDKGDGRYLCKYTVKRVGSYQVNVEYLGTFGGIPGPIRGSGAIVSFDEFSSRSNNMLSGPLMIRALKDEVLLLRNKAADLCGLIFQQLHNNSLSDEQRIRILMTIRDGIDRIEPLKEEMRLYIDRSEAAVAYLVENGASIGTVGTMLAEGKALWAKLLNDTDPVLNQIRPLMQQNVGKIRMDILGFLNHMKDIQRELSTGTFIDYKAGNESALLALTAADELLDQQMVAFHAIVSCL